MSPIHVVAAAIFDTHGQVLVARRPLHVHQGGLWEFPGGKLEAGETPSHALRRELLEELGIEVVRARPLIQIRHDYPDKSVLLDVWRVDEFSGHPHGREGQPVEWVAPDQLLLRDFPAANQAIISAVRLPSTCLVTPEPTDSKQFLHDLERALVAGVRLIQLRANTLGREAYRALAAACVPVVRQYGGTVLLNAEPDLVLELGADGVHLNGRRLREFAQRPLPSSFWVSAAAHDAGEVQQARQLGVDFLLVGSVLPTQTHPHVAPMGWVKFSELSRLAGVPVFALGGVGPGDMATAQMHGGQGVAGIRQFWPGRA